MHFLTTALVIATFFTFSQALALPGSAVEKPAPSQQFPYHEILDPNYELYWSFNDTHIIFETHVKTKGYVGFGISPNGGMKDSDIVIGWVKDGKAYFSDRYASANALPAVDASQDWFLLNATETGDYTILKMVRKLETCDPLDRAILKGTTRVIYSYSQDDPTSDSDIPYHGSSNRGTKSLLLLDPSSGEKSLGTSQDNVITIDFLGKNYSVPGHSTTYHDYTFKLQDLGKKHHVIRFEPIVQKGHEKLVHHMVLYFCDRKLDDSLVGISFETLSPPPGMSGVCENTLIAWAVGGTAYDFPSHVGLSLGTPLDPAYFRLETHYDNPDMRTDFVDSSGIRLFLTSDLRQNDAGVAEIGMAPDSNQIVPPYESNFVSRGFCQADCLAGAIGNQEIHVFAAFLHAHLLGRQLRVRHFRNGTELPVLSEDNNYDFDYQQTRDVSPEITLRKGDSLINECNLDSTGVTTVTYGGLSTHNEMCLSFVYYYPRTPWTFCSSQFIYDKLPSQYANKHATIADVIKQLHWTQASDREQFHHILNDSSIRTICHGDTSDGKFNVKVIPQPIVKDEYRAPSRCTGN